MEQKSIYECYQEIKHREIEELKEKVKTVGGQYIFPTDKPTYILCNFDYGPCDIRVDSVVTECTDNDCLTINGYDEEAGQGIEVELSDIAYGHIESITSAIQQPAI